jgi:hypothetical protein
VTPVNHKVGQWVFALTVGLLAAFAAYRWIIDPAPREERELQERVVLAARYELRATLGLQRYELVDPLAPDRKVGKAYVYRAGGGWEVSGYYRRDENDEWHAYLMTLSAMLSMTHLKVKDAAFLGAARMDARLEAVP